MVLFFGFIVPIENTISYILRKHVSLILKPTCSTNYKGYNDPKFFQTQGLENSAYLDQTASRVAV